MRILRMAELIIFHPIVAFTYIQRERHKFKAYPIVVLFVLAILVRLFSLQFTHYPLSTITRSTNLVLECLKLFVPLISWAIASYLMTTILDGETLFRESMLAVAYALTPYIIFMVPLTLLAQLLDINQAGLYYGLQTVILGWVILLIIISLKVMNRFTMGKTIGVLLLSLFTVAMLWVAVVLLYSIGMEFVVFIQEVFTELKYVI